MFGSLLVAVSWERTAAMILTLANRATSAMGLASGKCAKSVIRSCKTSKILTPNDEAQRCAHDNA
jgi:hypothetical protein